MVRTMTAEVAFPATALQGEGPAWDHATGTLLWVDVFGERVHRSDPATGHTATIEPGVTVSAVVPRTRGGLVAAVPGGFCAMTDAGLGDWLARVETDRPGNRMNDGKVAPDGSFWAGSMARDASHAAGSLYRLDPSGDVRTILSGLTISNGMGWSPDGATMYFIDTVTQSIDVIEPAPGSGWRRREFVRIPGDQGLPDGMCLDAEGNVWVAMYGGGQVLCFTPAGKHIATVTAPVPNTTSLCFGGADLDMLYITTARDGLSKQQLEDHRESGSVFVCQPGVRGTPTLAYRG